MTSADETEPLPSVRDLLAQLRAGETVCGYGHTLALFDGMGPWVLRGTNSNGVSYYGSLTRRYVEWWRSRLLAGESVGELLPYINLAPPASQPVDELVDCFLDDFWNDAAPAVKLDTAPGPDLLSPWARQVVATQLVKLLDEDEFSNWSVDRLGHGFEEVFRKIGREWEDPRKHADYPGLQALHYETFSKMDRDVAEGLPDAVLRVLGLDYPLLHELLGDRADMVIERFERGVVLPLPVPVVDVGADSLMPDVAPESVARPVSGWRRIFGVRSTPARQTV